MYEKDKKPNDLDEDLFEDPEHYEGPSAEDFLFTKEELVEKKNRKKERNTSGKLIAYVLVLALLVSGFSVWINIFNIPSFEFLRKSNELSKIENIQNYKEAVVTIEGGNSKGTGFNISPEGFIVTNHHVIDDMLSILVIFPQGEFYQATVKETYPELDIALLEIEAQNLPYLELQDQKEWKLDDHIYVIGNPLAYSQIVMEGNIAGLDSRMQISAPIHKGNSGSPVIDTNGLVIGVVYAKTIPQLGKGEESVGLAVPIDTIPVFEINK
ncbi:trypsin-like peptidase domain-containing protein [Bacillus luteolus]|uniref:Trypsin-like peptidase domain-containing protein n=1 Tax=Litchfieldia luteola TaxID=682179 RepID=A0ABR9QKE4_9BACI|nr:trypsin-like peptidase domain-containing protein [Cytobacillus luteolus]MBE4908980.1 trypsin-like peptidase domain-containing protein [Cytobacillus luteolus]MBP1941839.1 V8-like Glu-specific endopeptidase [Cytobacillus luteolus]